MTQARAEYVLIQPPKDGRVHVFYAGAFWIGAVCGTRVGDMWRIVRAYKLRGNARREATCPKCKTALRRADEMRGVR